MMKPIPNSEHPIEHLSTASQQLTLFPDLETGSDFEAANANVDTGNDDEIETPILRQLDLFPRSRYMGSKQAILPFIYRYTQPLVFTTALDAFSGSGSVSYLFKAMGKSVTSNDFMRFCYHTAHACIANSQIQLDLPTVEHILSPHPNPDTVIQDTFDGLYFTREENKLLDSMAAQIRELDAPFQKSIAYAAIAWACLRRRPRGLFTYTGMRYDDGRRDLQTSLIDHFRNAVQTFNQAVFETEQGCVSYNLNVSELPPDLAFDLVYLDPPYVSPYSDNDYTRRYHFVEGLVRYWDG
ncbi:MAG: hypothetical protein HC853_08475 [Anaerolineae bacterium]|nr:hypothetical protein [Anaerolineae bacterium]